MPGSYTRRPADKISIGPHVLDSRRELAAEIGLITAYWSDLELLLSRIFCALLLRQERMAFDIYHTIRDRDLRRQVLLAASKGLLTVAQTARISKLYESIRRAAPDRHLVVHAIWAITDRRGKENTLLRVDEKAFNVHFSDYCRSCLDNLFVSAAEISRAGRVVTPREIQELALRKSIADLGDITEFTHYGAKDFIHIRGRIDALREEASKISSGVLATSMQAAGHALLSKLRHQSGLPKA